MVVKWEFDSNDTMIFYLVYVQISSMKVMQVTKKAAGDGVLQVMKLTMTEEMIMISIILAI